MEEIYEQLMGAIASNDIVEVRRLVETGVDLNHRCDQGASVLFGAILYGNLSIMELLLTHGADPNLVAEEPASFIYADKPLGLARGARFPLDWDLYDATVKLLERFGATESEYLSPNQSLESVENEARAWQTRQLKNLA